MMPNAYENTTSLMTQIEKYFLNEDLLGFDKTTERIFFSFQLSLQREINKIFSLLRKDLADTKERVAEGQFLSVRVIYVQCLKVWTTFKKSMNNKQFILQRQRIPRTVGLQ